MSKRQILMLLGLWTMAFLFLGFPASYHKVLALVTGLAVIVIAYRTAAPEKIENKTNVPFVDHKSAPLEPADTQSPIQG